MCFDKGHEATGALDESQPWQTVYTILSRELTDRHGGGFVRCGIKPRQLLPERCWHADGCCSSKRGAEDGSL
jgi:hypothetical protein